MTSPLSLPCTVILGSGSPRRKELLRTIVPEFEIRISDAEENYPDDLSVGSIPEFLALKKARALQGVLTQHELLITADTVVISNGFILEKPGNAEVSRTMLRELSGNIHEVKTGVCIMTKEFEKTFCETTKVHFEVLSEEEITYYIENFKPFDKAGSYGIQEWIGHAAVSGIEGCYYNVVGLPVSRLYQELKNLF